MEWMKFLDVLKRYSTLPALTKYSSSILPVLSVGSLSAFLPSRLMQYSSG